MNIKKTLFSCFVIICLFSACGEDKDCCFPAADYSKGIFVVNEGPFGGTGTISWHNPETGETQDSLFEKANNGAVLGQFVQSLTFYNGRGYIAVTGANRVVVVDAQTFKFIDTIGGLEKPRYFLPFEEFAYVSEWGNDGVSGSLAKIDWTSYVVVTKIPVGHGPEKMLYSNTGALFVANSGGFGTDSTVASVDPYNASLSQKFVSEGLNPASIVFNNNGLFALCKGNYDPVNPAGALLSNLGPTTFGIQVPGGSDDLVGNADGTELYFIGGGSVWVYKNNQLQKLFDQPAYGLALDSEQNLLYCADDKGFAGPGEVVIYKTDGTKVGSFRTGVGPGEIVILK